MQKVSKIAVYALSGLICVALAPRAVAQCSIVGTQVICTQDFGSVSTDVGHNGSGTLSLFDPSLYTKPGGGADPLISVTLTLTGITTSNGTLQNTSTTTTETYNITQLVNISGASANGDLTIASFPSQFGPQSLTLAPGVSGAFSGTGSGQGSSPSSSNATVLADFTGPGTFTVNFHTGAAFTSITGGTDFLINGVPTEDVVGTVTYSLQFAPVPELSSSIGLAALVLGGGAFGLRRRRRK